MTERQWRFVDAYLIDPNASAAARAAGFKGKRTDQAGYDFLRNPDVAAAIAKGQAERAARHGITADRVLQEVARLAFMDVRKLYGDDRRLKAIPDLDDDSAAAIAGMEVAELWDTTPEGKLPIGELKKVRLWNKVESLNLLGKHLKLFIERVEHGGMDGKPIEVLYGTGSKKSLV